MVASASAGAKSSPVMNALTETLARATLVGGAFPPKARAPDFPLVTSFYLERAPDDAALETFARALASFPELGCRATAADARSDAGTVPSSSSPCTKTSSHAHVASREQPNVRPS